MRLIGLGHAVLDHVLLVETFPDLDSKTLARQGLLCTGGPVPRAVLSAAALGQDTAFAGCLGRDEAGLQVRRDLEAAGVDLGALHIVDQATPRASIWVEARHGKRTVVLDRGGLPDYPAYLVEALPWGPGMLLLDGKEPAGLLAAQHARQAGMDVMLDLGGPREDMTELVSTATVVAVSKAFIMHAYPGLDLMVAVENLVQAGPRLAVITLGAGGAVVCEQGGQAMWFPAWHPGGVVDSTGAGDVYHGALAWALLQGFATRKALACAAVAGGMACRQLGGAVPGLDQNTLLAQVDAAAEFFA
jgi:sugar/nucleoside kinase (ribokinase family)